MRWLIRAITALSLLLAVLCLALWLIGHWRLLGVEVRRPDGHAWWAHSADGWFWFPLSADDYARPDPGEGWSIAFYDLTQWPPLGGLYGVKSWPPVQTWAGIFGRRYIAVRPWLFALVFAAMPAWRAWRSRQRRVRGFPLSLGSEQPKR